MTQDITIGILQPDPGWITALRQLGLAYRTVRRVQDMAADSLGAIILNRKPVGPETAAVRAFLDSGGVAIDACNALPESRQAGYPEDHIALGRAGAGHVAAVRFDLHSMITDTRSVRKLFASASGRHPSELVARYPKGEVRRALGRALRWLLHRRGLPYVYLARVPRGSRGVFCFRVDSDYGTLRQCRALYQTARRYGVKMTWFLHTGAHEEWIAEMVRFEDQEFAVHGHRHRTFRGYQQNFANITESRRVMDAAGMQYCGYSAPNGVWNKAVHQATADHGFAYSSEFALGYDDLPFFPCVDGRFSPVLQIPTHPVCIGSLMRVKEPVAGMMDYFRQVIDDKLHAGEPVALYHHPPHEHWNVVDDIFAHAVSLGLRNMTFGQYAQWWLRRSALRFTPRMADGHLQIEWAGESPGPDHEAVAEYPGERHESEEGIRIPQQIRPTFMDAVRLTRDTIEDFNSRFRQ